MRSRKSEAAKEWKPTIRKVCRKFTNNEAFKGARVPDRQDEHSRRIRHLKNRVVEQEKVESTERHGEDYPATYNGVM
eukprot:857633-Pleurochrysis_carterae.AAC.1